MAQEEDNPATRGELARIAQENMKKWAQLVARAWTDDKLKQRLLNAPEAVLREHGLDVPAGVEMRVVENTPEVTYLTLPLKPALEVTDFNQLVGIAGLFTTCGCACRDPHCQTIVTNTTTDTLSITVVLDTTQEPT
jgi:Nitrile hydratase, alpha chain